MSDDERTRKVKAVHRKPQNTVANEATRPVKAVKRRATKLGLLPEAALTARAFRFLETNLGWGFESDFTTHRYEVQLDDRTPILQAPPRFSLLPGWRFELLDLADRPRFTLSLGLQKLVMRTLTVLAPDGEVLGRLEQRFSLMDVKFDILNPDGSTHFTLYQPSDVFTRYEVRVRDACVARISKDRPDRTRGFRDMMAFEDAFKVELESSLLDERDRVLLIASAIFMDRVFHTGKRG